MLTPDVPDLNLFLPIFFLLFNDDHVIVDVVCDLESKFIALLIYEINNKSIYMYTIMKKYKHRCIFDVVKCYGYYTIGLNFGTG